MFLLPGNTMGYCLNTGRFAGEGAADYAADCGE
jgi:fumarate reductase flavoprotein subunit